jgi:hypothetical protein
LTQRFRNLAAALALVLATVSPAFAQGTNGLIEGSVLDQQGLALPGVVVTATNTSNGFSRSATTDTAGTYRIGGLPVGTYEVKAALSGFSAQARKTNVNVESTSTVPFRMSVAGQTENVEVTAEAPLIDSKDSGVGEVISAVQIENLPLNGRQFGNLAALVPGVSLGFHTDPTKSTQFAPQVAGGGGRNINYLIDGGDNNDDTVGGLVQNFPLDSIGEFKFETQRFRADTGRANGGTIKVVTKSGTNEFKGSVFEYFRNKSLNSKTTTEINNKVGKGEYKKNQFGGSLGGPIVKDKTHFFISAERVQQDTTQSVNTNGLFPDKDGVFNVPFRENMAVAKINHQVNSNNYLSVRYGYNTNEQPYGAGPLTPPEGWGISNNKFHSLNANLNSALSGGRLNEFVYQYSYFLNTISANSALPYESFPGGVSVGQSVNTPQSTFQKKHQFRDDFSFTKGRHDLRVGASFIYEPTLDITFSTGQVYQYTHLTASRTSPISAISRNGSIGGTSGGSGATIPNNQYAFYMQDGWRMNDKLTLDIGVRYDLVTGFAFDQSKNIIFAEMQAAAKAGKFTGSICPCIGLEDFGKEAKEDTNNIAPRLGFTYDSKADGTMVFRGGIGRYYDFAYTNANILFAVIGAQSSFGGIYSNTNSTGIRNADGSFYQIGQPLPPNQLANASAPLPSHVATPLTKQPYTDQANFGFSKGLGKDYALEVDGVYAHGQDLGTRVRLNVRMGSATAPRRFASILPQSGTSNFRVDLMEGVSHYKGVNIAIKKRSGKLNFTAWYSLSKSTSSASLRATDEFGEYDALNAFDPFADNQEGPVRTDARHRFTVNGTWNAPGGFRVSPIFRYKSKTPYNVITGVDSNLDGLNYDLPAGVTSLNSARGADFKQFDLRLAKTFNVMGKRLELIGEGFNVTNATNPGGFVSQRNNANFGKPTTYAGDFQRGEQRLFQLGVRFEF